MSIEDQIKSRIKVAAYKPMTNPDDRVSLCGEPFQQDDEGRWYAIIPHHCLDYQRKLHPHYEFSEPFEVPVGETPAARKPGRPRK